VTAIEPFRLAGRTVFDNPSPEELRSLTAALPTARETDFGNLNVQTNVLSRSKRSVFVVGDDPEESGQVVSRERAARLAGIQDEYMASRDVIVIDGCIGNDPSSRVSARLVIEAAYANIAAMQQQLYFPPLQSAEPELTIVYTPSLPAVGFPNERLILVDLERRVTRIFNSDYFGESKKAGLRMWNKHLYEHGGLALHAGCKVIPTAAGPKVGLVIGLSGTGKTTTTFTRQNDSLPVQDDFVGWTADGRIVATEAGCFAKTFALTPDDEPVIYGAVTSPAAYLENVSQQGGEVDFFDTGYTHNGRATFELSAIESAVERSDLRPDFILILNRNENVIPAVAKLRGPQAAGYFMLGETQGTSAGGADEAGKFLRVPGTNPFFPLPHELQGNRFLELLEASEADVYLMNTGRIGGPETDDRSKKVLIAHSSAIVRAIAERTMEWERDLDFGYDVASNIPGIDDIEIAQPRRFYERHGRGDEYDRIVARLIEDRRAYLERFAGLRSEIRALTEEADGES
jgi:phosphoenolpyruvate carboxykinase (ATP)